MFLWWLFNFLFVILSVYMDWLSTANRDCYPQVMIWDFRKMLCLIINKQYQLSKSWFTIIFSQWTEMILEIVFRVFFFFIFLLCLLMQMQLPCYRNKHIFSGVYWCITWTKSLTNLHKSPKDFYLFVSELVQIIHQ